jgi:metal-sulfur cluster biosynthetic enzyme
MNSNPVTEAAVLTALRQVIDPEVGMDIVDLGLIYDVAITGSQVRVAMTLTSAGCPMGESLRSGAQFAVLNLDGVTDVDIELVFDPPWTPAMIASAEPA